jgi:ribosome-associated heat shock protein Hsp15
MAKGAGNASGLPSLRIDKFLWFARVVKSRSQAQALAEKGVIRLNGRRIERAHSAVRTGDLVTIPMGQAVRVLRIVSLPDRRGSAQDAAVCYEALMVGGDEPFSQSAT